VGQRQVGGFALGGGERHADQRAASGSRPVVSVSKAVSSAALMRASQASKASHDSRVS
jgi:hypothetical protein